MVERQNSMHINTGRLPRWLQVAVMCWCLVVSGATRGEMHGALSVTPQDTDKAGIENQIRQLKQKLITALIKRHALPQVAGQIGTVP